MLKFSVALASLLAVLAPAFAFAQISEEHAGQIPPADLPTASAFAADAPPESPPPEKFGPESGETLTTDELISLNDKTQPAPLPSLQDFWGYRYSTSSLDWIPGGGDHFGMFSIAWDHYQKSGLTQGLGVGMDFNFLAGPKSTDMPPRVFDFSLGYQLRHRFGPLGFDVAAAVKASSDFEGSARKGIRFPGHAVGFFDAGPEVELVFGVDYLDRDDFRLLPVAGVIWIPDTEMRFEFVFPRPRAVFRLTDEFRLYVAGELGGGTWAVERRAVGNDVSTYHDLRTCLGVEYVQKDGRRTALEVGYLFDRRLDFESGIGNMRFHDAMMLRLVSTH